MIFPAFGTYWFFAHWAWGGWMGVYLFFVLSGYLLGSQLSEQPLSKTTVFTFWKRRFLRIYPAFWFQLSILLTFGALTGLFFHFTSWQYGIQHFILWVNLPPAWVSPMNPVWWTLPIELSFYLLLPFVIYLQRKVGISVVLLATVGLMFVWRTIIIQQHPDVNLSTVVPLLDAIPGSLATFVAGLSLVFMPKAKLWVRKLVLICALCALYFWAHHVAESHETYWTGGNILIYSNFIIATIMAAIVYACLESYPAISFLSSKLFVWLGHISYGIYLWHFPILLLMKHVWPSEWAGSQLYGSLALLVCLISSCILASISYYYIERPAMRLWR